MNNRYVNQSRQKNGKVLAIPLSLLVPAGGSVGYPFQCDVGGYATVFGMLASAVAAPFSVTIFQYPIAGGLIPQQTIASAPAPLGGIERIDFTRPVTGNFATFMVTNPNLFPIAVLCLVQFRPISSYDLTVSMPPFPPGPYTVQWLRGGTILHYNGNSGGVSTPMFPANANRLEVFGLNLGPRPITIAFTVPAVFGAGQTIPANTPFRFDRESGLAINFIDDGGPGGAIVSATEIATP